MHDSPIFKEPPIVITPSLAKMLGLNEAIIIQQIRYWLTYKERNKQDYHNGRYWVYNSYENWEKQFPFWSIATIRRTIKNLEEKGVLISGNFNKKSFDRTKWYTIDFEKLDRLYIELENSVK